MFDYFDAHNDVERWLTQIVEHFLVSRKHLEASLWMRVTRDFDPLPAQIYAHNLASTFDKFTARKPVPATDIERSRGWIS